MSEQPTLDQRIDSLKQIKRTSQPDENYAKAQWQLGYIFENDKKDYAQAKQHYSAVTHADSPEKYAAAQCCLGIIFEFDEKNIKQAKPHYLAVSHADNPEMYATAQCRLGIIFEFHEKNIKQAKPHYLAVTHADSPEMYAHAQYRLGRIFEFDEKNTLQAKPHYLAVSHADSPEIYAAAQYLLGRIFEFDEKNTLQAKPHYLAVSHADSPEIYAAAQYRLGHIFEFDEEDTLQAKPHFLAVTHADNPEVYAHAQYRLGRIFEFIEKNTLQAKQHFANVSYKYNRNMYYDAQLKLALIDSEKYDTHLKSILTNLLQMDKSVSAIKTKLLVKLEANFEQNVAHYTKPEVLFYCLQENDPSPMRLNLVNLMNDPTENKVLFNWLKLQPNRDRNNIKSFVTSFSFNHNSLNQFRLYGLENSVHGSGVSLVFKPSFFSQKEKDSFNLDKITEKMNNIISDKNLEKENTTGSSDDIFPLPLYRCVYFEPESGYISIAKRNKLSFYHQFCGEDRDEIENKWEAYIEHINETEIIKTIKQDFKKIENNIKKSIKTIGKFEKSQKNAVLTRFNDLLYLVLMPISCLIKHAAFEDEDECRIMYTTDISNPLIEGPGNYEV